MLAQAPSTSTEATRVYADASMDHLTLSTAVFLGARTARFLAGYSSPTVSCR